ncbi:hypothetical protein [Paenibacillus swuensis]|uniref:hypothetical protein n=1 Tax=Paenibacillus swuensis TaxID=1178515 RepID=UPI000839171B|nr:hypothetical protein [Paenibacillus swuensis]
MKKILFTMWASMFILIGCTDQNEPREDYIGGPLKIALLSSNKQQDLKNIDFEMIEDLDTLATASKPYDGLIIAEDRLQEADQEKYVSFYDKVTYPIFFWGTENTQGFKNNGDGSKKTWELNLPDSPNEYSKNQGMLIQMLNAIDSDKNKN